MARPQANIRVGFTHPPAQWVKMNHYYYLDRIPGGKKTHGDTKASVNCRVPSSNATGNPAGQRGSLLPPTPTMMHICVLRSQSHLVLCLSTCRNSTWTSILSLPQCLHTSTFLRIGCHRALYPILYDGVQQVHEVRVIWTGPLSFQICATRLGHCESVGISAEIKTDFTSTTIN